MKAKEYAAKYKEAQDKAECIYEIIRDMLLETEQIVKARNIKKGSSLMDVFSEVERKWLAFVRQADIQFNNGPHGPFRFIFRKLMPEIYNEWELHKIRIRVRMNDAR